MFFILGIRQENHTQDDEEQETVCLNRETYAARSEYLVLGLKSVVHVLKNKCIYSCMYIFFILKSL